MSGPPETADLRARRRLQTRADIRDSAVDLVHANGFGNVTIEQICARAGISQRTFFNYFPTKEAAIAAGPPPLPQHLVDQFVAAGNAPWSTVFRDLVALLSEHLGAAPTRPHLAALLDIAATTAAVHAALLSGFQRQEEDLADMVARRCGARPDDGIPAMIAALTMTTIRAGMMRWAASAPANSEEAGPANSDDSPLPFVRQAAADVAAIFAE
jgi:AcrR family transcriptional regulator